MPRTFCTKILKTVIKMVKKNSELICSLTNPDTMITDFNLVRGTNVGNLLN